jgi:hypothetical protein
LEHQPVEAGEDADNLLNVTLDQVAPSANDTGDGRYRLTFLVPAAPR